VLYYGYLYWRHTKIVAKKAQWDKNFLYPYQVALEVVAHYQINGSCSQNLVAVGEDRPEYVWETKIRETRNFRARPLDYLKKYDVHARLHRRLLAWCTGNIPFSWELLHDRQTESAGEAEDAQDIVTLTMYEADTIVETLEHMRIIVDALAKYETPPQKNLVHLKKLLLEYGKYLGKGYILESQLLVKVRELIALCETPAEDEEPEQLLLAPPTEKE